MDGVAVASTATAIISTDNIIRRERIHTDDIRVAVNVSSSRSTEDNDKWGNGLKKGRLDIRQERFHIGFVGSFFYRDIVFECNKYSDATVFAKEPISRFDSAFYSGGNNGGKG